jgi:hypothetical protein
MTVDQAKRADDISDKLCKFAVRKIKASDQSSRVNHIHKQQLELAVLGRDLIVELESEIEKRGGGQ